MVVLARLQSRLPESARAVQVPIPAHNFPNVFVIP